MYNTNIGFSFETGLHSFLWLPFIPLVVSTTKNN